jgi:acyl-CoA thioester hydrolase
MTKCLPDSSRWTIRHELYRADGLKCAEVIIDGAFMSMETRKLIVPPAEFAAKFAQLARQ